MSDSPTDGGLGPDDRVESGIAAWREYVHGLSVDAGDVDTAEASLRSEVDVLRSAGLGGDEALVIALRRRAVVDESSRAFAAAHFERAWQRVGGGGAHAVDGQGVAARGGDMRGGREAVLFAVLAAMVVQVARLLERRAGGDGAWAFQNAPWLVAPVLAAWSTRRRGLGLRPLGPVLVACAAAVVVLNAYPYDVGSSTEVLASVHVPFVLWAALAVPFAGGWSRVGERAMDYVRFTGEWFVHYVLIALGGGVLMGLTGAVLVPVGVDVESVASWVLPTGAAGAVVIAAWLVDGGPRVAGGMAQVLTMLFTPLFAVMLAAAAVLYAVRGVGQSFDREMLGVYDALLVVVLALVLYAASARRPGRAPGWDDRVQLVAVVGAVVLDALVLVSMVSRVSDLGLTPNRVTALGLNVLLLTALVGGAWRSIRFLAGRDTSPRLGNWLVGFLPVLAGWAAMVAVVLPIAFSFE